MRAALRKRPDRPAGAAGCPLSTARDRMPVEQDPRRHRVGGSA